MFIYLLLIQLVRVTVNFFTKLEPAWLQGLRKYL